MKKLSLLLLIVIPLSCTKKENPGQPIAKYSYMYQNNKISIEMVTPEDKITTEGLKKIFDSNYASFYKIDNPDDLQFGITFSKPVYLSSLSIKFKKGSTVPADSFITIDGQINENNMPNIEEKILLKNNAFTLQRKDVLFKTGVLSIIFNFSRKASISISEIDLVPVDSPIFTPKVSFEEIKNEFSKPDRDWKLDVPGKTKDYDILQTLAYYALRGNRQAEKMLYDMQPTGAADGQIHSAVLEDYEISKK